MTSTQPELDSEVRILEELKLNPYYGIRVFEEIDNEPRHIVQTGQRRFI